MKVPFLEKIKEKITLDLAFGPVCSIVLVGVAATIAMLIGVDPRQLASPLGWSSLPPLTRGFLGIVLAFAALFALVLPYLTVRYRPNVGGIATSARR